MSPTASATASSVLPVASSVNPAPAVIDPPLSVSALRLIVSPVPMLNTALPSVPPPIAIARPDGMMIVSPPDGGPDGFQSAGVAKELPPPPSQVKVVAIIALRANRLGNPAFRR